MRVEHIGDATLYLGDCLEILPTLDKVVPARFTTAACWLNRHIRTVGCQTPTRYKSHHTLFVLFTLCLNNP